MLVCKDSNRLLTKEKGVRVLDLEIVVFPWFVNTIILNPYVCIKTKSNKLDTKIANKTNRLANNNKSDLKG